MFNIYRGGGGAGGGGVGGAGVGGAGAGDQEQEELTMTHIGQVSVALYTCACNSKSRSIGESVLNHEV